MKKLLTLILLFVLTACTGSVDLNPGNTEGITEQDVRSRMLATGGNQIDVLHVDTTDAPMYQQDNTGTPINGENVTLHADGTFGFYITCADYSTQWMPWIISGFDAAIIEFWSHENYTLYINKTQFECGKFYHADAANDGTYYFLNNPVFISGYGAEFRVTIYEKVTATPAAKPSERVNELRIGLL